LPFALGVPLILIGDDFGHDARFRVCLWSLRHRREHRRATAVPLF
jgi:hypothetical protein